MKIKMRRCYFVENNFCDLELIFEIHKFKMIYFKPL